MSERRLHLRVPLRVPVVITGRRQIRTWSTGLSCGGIACLAEGLEKGEAVSLAMNLPRSAMPVVVSATVAHIHAGVAGIAFTRLRQEEAQAIEQCVWDTLCPAPEEGLAGESGPGVRLSFRVPLDVPVTIVRGEARLIARATGLSPGGIAVREAELVEGEQVTVELCLPGIVSAMSVSGVVARSGSGIAGIRFVGLSQADLRELEDRIWRYLKGAVRGTPETPAPMRPQVNPSADHTERILVAMDEAMAERVLSGDKRTCEIPGCNRPHKARGLCSVHYRKLRQRRG